MNDSIWKMVAENAHQTLCLVDRELIALKEYTKAVGRGDPGEILATWRDLLPKTQEDLGGSPILPRGGGE